MIKESIGRCAGTIWQTLNKGNSLSSKQLQKQSGLSAMDYHMAIGWLARENKIHFFHRDKELFVCIN